MENISASDVFLMGCNHVGQDSMLKYRPEFANAKEHDNATWDLLDQVKDYQAVVFLGDSFISPWSLNKLKQYKFKKILILGNHEFDMGNTITQYAEVIDEIHGCLKFNNLIFTHAPVAYKSMAADAINIHAHIHTNEHFSRRHINVNMEALCYRLISLDKVLKGEYKQFSFFDNDTSTCVEFIGDSQEVDILNYETFVYSLSGVLVGRINRYEIDSDKTRLVIELNNRLTEVNETDNFGDLFLRQAINKSTAKIIYRKEIRNV